MNKMLRLLPAVVLRNPWFRLRRQQFLKLQFQLLLWKRIGTTTRQAQLVRIPLINNRVLTKLQIEIYKSWCTAGS